LRKPFINLNINAYDDSGTVLSTALLHGLQWLYCTSLSAVVPVAHVVMTASLMASPDPAYYGSCDPLTLP
jgi:hypothetical protein